MQETEAPSADTLVTLNRLATTARLMSGAFHEVNNILMVISATVEMLDLQRDLPEPVRGSLERIQKQTERAAGAMNNVLLFARGPLTEQGPTNLRDVVTHSIALRQYAIRRAGLSVETIADAAARWSVTGNRTRLQLAILNLLLNAEQALAGTGGAIRVEMLGEPGRVGVRVSDSGPGLPLGMGTRVFEAFVSGQPAPEGGGLGLWAARLIAETHGGTLEVEPVASGASLMLWLPRT